MVLTDRLLRNKPKVETIFNYKPMIVDNTIQQYLKH